MIIEAGRDSFGFSFCRNNQPVTRWTSDCDHVEV
jgi:hypothetical protein